MHLGIVIAFKNTTFSAPKSASETALESTYFVKNWQKFGEKAGNHICFKKFFFLEATLFVFGGNSSVMLGWQIIVFMKPNLYFSPDTLQITCIS